VSIIVTDNGPGMSDDVKRRCMEPFYTTKAREISTGLGLALVYGIVRDAGGTIDLDSVQGQGTTFTLRLRRAETATAAATGLRRRAHVDIKDDRMRAIVAAELNTLSYDVRFDAESASGADLIVADRNDVPRSGKVVLLTASDHAPASAVTLGDKPKVSAIREALRRLAAGV
jgi:histidine kinase/DNA gyrase B/HSP90-like ATPase